MEIKCIWTTPALALFEYINVNKVMERQHFIDQLKAVSIFLIVFGHNDNSSVLGDYLTTFIVPLFFIISGYLTKDKQFVLLGDYLKKMTRRLIVPYFLISFFLYFFWLFIERPFAITPGSGDPIKNLIGIFYSQGGGEYMEWGIIMWFFPALFCISMIDFFVSKLDFKYRVIPVLVLPVIGTLIFSVLGFHLPWNLDNAMVLYPFYFWGSFMKRIDICSHINGKEVWMFILLFVLFIIGAAYNKPINYYYASFGSVPMMYINGISGSMAFFVIFKILPSSKMITWVGENTLPILAFHFLTLSVIQGIAYYFFRVRLEFTILMSFFYAILQIILLVPVIILLNQYFPVVVGLQKSQESALLKKFYSLLYFRRINRI